MSAGPHTPTRGTGGPSSSGPNSISSSPRSNSSTPRSLSSSPAGGHDVALRQKIDPRKQHHTGGASSSGSEQKTRSQPHQLSISAKPYHASAGNSRGSSHPSVREPSAENSKAKTQTLTPEVTNKLPPTLRKFVLTDKVAIVTGGARGLGHDMAEGLCESGIKAVAIFDIQPTLGESVAQRLQTTHGCQVKYYNVDVTNEKIVEASVRQVVATFGCIDILVNSAGVAFSNLPAESHLLETFQRTININLVGSFCIARAVARHMIKAASPSTSSTLQLRDRSIIFIASMSGSIVNYPQPQCAYNASKAGVISLSKCLAAEWAKYGIRVNTISPGYMDTVLNKTPALDSQKVIWKDRTPLKRMGEVEELNNVVVWLAGEGSRFCTGSDVRVDGGYSVY